MLITETYRALNAEMHRAKPHFGNGNRVRDETVKIARLNRIASILDYGCGKGAFKRSMPPDLIDKVREYDPAIPGKETAEPAEMVICSDVLEHVEPECLADVLRDLRRLTLRVGIFLIATSPATKHLPDGRNAHLIVQDAGWWNDRLTEAEFHIAVESDAGGDHVVIVA